MNYVSLIIGKTVIFLMRLLGRNANTLPGLIIEKLNPKFLDSKLSKLPNGVIIVTGTNGKTTTTKLLSSLLSAQGLRVLSNQTGGNFVRGIISLVLDKTSLTNKLDYDVAVLELDEAHGVRFVNYSRPRGVIALNILRDQLDRFGEIDQTAELVAKIAKSSKDFIVLNSNDPRISKISDQVKNREIYWYGYSSKLKDIFISDDQHYSKDVNFFEAHRPDVELLSFNENKLVINADMKRELPFKLTGSYNAVNIVAAIAGLNAIISEVDYDKVTKVLSEFRPAFGRGEVLELKNGVSLQLQLVKNPSGFNQALNITSDHHFDKVGIVINDNYSDGRDVSWLYDVNFKVLKNLKIYVGGIRYLDMALRLKLLDIDSNTCSSLQELIKDISKLEKNQKAIIYCTYTAMLEIRNILKDKVENFEEVGL